MNELFSNIVPIVAILATFGVPAAVIIVWTVLRYREKMLLINKGFPAGADLPGYPGRAPLFWGMLLTTVSAVGIILALIQSNFHGVHTWFIILTVGITLLVYWKVNAPLRQRKIEFYERRFNEMKLSGGTGE